jgi:predicted phage terminase large subunit-like protein
VLVMTRWHEDDLAGRLLRSQPEQWRVLKLPAIAEENDPLGRLEGEPLWNDDPDYGYGGRLLDIYAEMERAGRLRDWFALYQGRPRPPEGTMFKPAEMPIIEALPREMIWDQVRAWDLASSTTGDWTVGLKLAVVSDGQNVDFVVSDVHRMRGRPDEVRRAVRAIAEADGYGVKIWLPQDPAQAGMDQVQSYIHLLMGYAVEAERMTGNKVIRADAVASQCNIRKVGMLRGSWNALFADELASFPSGQHDDQVDALSLAFSKVAGVASALRLWRRM